jgi:hypothetical protein
VCPLARASAKPFLIFESSCERRISGLGLAHLLCFQDFASKISGIKDLGWYQKPKLLIPEILPRYPGVGGTPAVRSQVCLACKREFSRMHVT